MCRTDVLASTLMDFFPLYAHFYHFKSINECEFFFFFFNIADRTSIDYMPKFVLNFLTAHLPTRDSKDVQGLPDCFVLRRFNSFHLNLTD